APHLGTQFGRREVSDLPAGGRVLALSNRRIEQAASLPRTRRIPIVDAAISAEAFWSTKITVEKSYNASLKEFLSAPSKIEIRNARDFWSSHEISCLWKNCEFLVNVVPRFRKIFSCRVA